MKDAQFLLAALFFAHDRLPLGLRRTKDDEAKSWMHLGIVSVFILLTIILLFAELVWETTHMRNYRLAITYLGLSLYVLDLMFLFILQNLALCTAFFIISLNCVIVMACVTEGGSVLCFTFPSLALIPGNSLHFQPCALCSALTYESNKNHHLMQFRQSTVWTTLMLGKTPGVYALVVVIAEASALQWFSPAMVESFGITPFPPHHQDVAHGILHRLFSFVLIYTVTFVYECLREQDHRRRLKHIEVYFSPFLFSTAAAAALISHFITQNQHRVRFSVQRQDA